MHDYHTMPPGDLTRFLHRTKASSALPEDPDMGVVLSQILQKAAELVPSESGAILLDDPLTKGEPRAENELHFVAAFGPAAAGIIGASIRGTEGVAGHVYRTGTAHLAVHTREDETFADRIDRETGYRTESIIAAPIRIGEAVCGTIELINRSNGQPFDAHDLVLLEIFASYTASSVQNALDARTAQALARMDDLTGLFNDRYLHARLREELAAATREGAPCALLFIDLDRFKPVNDQYGHLVGSQVLREVGFLLRRATADVDAVLARYGGDEFAIVLPGRTAVQASEVAERVRSTIAEAVFLDRERGPDLPALSLRGAVTASVGVAAVEPGDPPAADLPRWLLQTADEAMYRAKAAGRDRVEVGSRSPA